jgi:hypothetical protein
LQGLFPTILFQRQRRSPDDQQGATAMRRQHTVLELRVDFKYDDLEEARKRAFGRIFKAIGQWAKPGKHGRATITILVVTTETSAELLGRLTPTLEQIDGVDNRWCSVAPQVAVALHGGNDPYVHWLEASWKEARKRNESHHMRQSQRFGVAKRRV